MVEKEEKNLGQFQSAKPLAFSAGESTSVSHRFSRAKKKRTPAFNGSFNTFPIYHRNWRTTHAIPLKIKAGRNTNTAPQVLNTGNLAAKPHTRPYFGSYNEGSCLLLQWQVNIQY
jgi:hypothetical protein